MKVPAYIIAKAERANRLASIVESLNQEIEGWMESKGVDCPFDAMFDAGICEDHGMTVDVDALKSFMENM